MAVLDIARMGNPILRRKAEPVADPAAPGLRRLVSDMLETMDYAGGTGLAAPQVHVPVRVVIFHIEGSRVRLEDDPEDGTTEESRGRGGSKRGRGGGLKNLPTSGPARR